MNVINPKISVGISTYNRKDLLRLSLKSVLDQTFDDYEVIVVDDGSTDGTEEMVRKEFPMVRYIYKENGGDASAKNVAAKEAKGKYLLYNDSDDCFYPDTLERLYEPLKTTPEACVYGQYRHLDIEGNESDAKLKMKHFPSGNILEYMLEHIIVHSTGCIRPREAFLRAGAYDESLRQSHDYKLDLTLARELPYIAVQEPVFQRRRHESNLSSCCYKSVSVQYRVVREFFEKSGHELDERCQRILRKRLASLCWKLAREAAREKMARTLRQQHLEESLLYAFSWKVFFAKLFS